MSAPNSSLSRALQLSEQILCAAEGTDLRALASLDAERLQLLKSFRCNHGPAVGQDARLLGQIMALNERAMGLLEHRKRGKGREMDVAAAGRRAVAAYGDVRMRR